ncbi:MAG: hypothetical protein M3Q32_08560 [Pseudomonadota bacterium]|nr:hypothetical protein [Burkholderiales bacterium]MDQ3196395.1 hypothetical protein [Pseudomonadota bacterium]
MLMRSAVYFALRKKGHTMVENRRAERGPDSRFAKVRALSRAEIEPKVRIVHRPDIDSAQRPKLIRVVALIAIVVAGFVARSYLG